MNTYIYINKKEKINDIQFEVVETKGKGHPDNICDTLAEKISSNYSKYCMEKYGMTKIELLKMMTQTLQERKKPDKKDEIEI